MKMATGVSDAVDPSSVDLILSRNRFEELLSL